MFQTTEAIEEVARALALIADPRRDDQKAKGLEAGGEDDGMMTSQGTLMAESIAVDGAQQVRGAEDERVSSVQSIQGFGNRVSSGSGGIAGTEVQNGGAAEDVGAEIEDSNGDNAAKRDHKPAHWDSMSETKRRNWRKYQNAKRNKKP